MNKLKYYMSCAGTFILVITLLATYVWVSFGEITSAVVCSVLP